MVSLTTGILYWVYRYQQVGPTITTVDRENTAALDSIADTEGADSYSFDKRYTVFSTTPISTGEIVVTAKSYLPGEFSRPDYQYCYLTLSTKATVAAHETQLATYENAQVQVITDDPLLVDGAVPFCDFTTAK